MAFMLPLALVGLGLAVGTIVAALEMRRAPIGIETEEGFYFDTACAREYETQFAAAALRFQWL